MTKYIFITGNYNKSIFTASLGSLLRENNLKINIKKILDNKPTQTYVTKDGSEVDLNLGYYERIAELTTNINNNIFTSNINELIKFIKYESKSYDIIIIELIDINIINYFLKRFSSNLVINIHIQSNNIQSDIKSDIIINKDKFIKLMYINQYKIPYILSKIKFNKKVLKLLDIKQINKITKWEQIYYNLLNLHKCIYVYIIIKFSDSYIAVMESLKHAAYSLNLNIKIIWINPEILTIYEMIKIINKNKGGILVPGGFGINGFENKIEIIKFARLNNIPFFGICYGMQLLIIEYARNILNINNATTQEVDTENKYTHIFIENCFKQRRVGNYCGKIKEKSILTNLYKNNIYSERHRHKYKFNNIYIDKFKNNGLSFIGTSFDDTYMEITHVQNNIFHMGVQFHPELGSTIFKPNPIIVLYIKKIYLSCIKN